MNQPLINPKILEIRNLAEVDFPTFVALVAPKRVWGAIHRELKSWMVHESRKKHTLILLPRGHQKSTLIAYWVAWRITRNPAVTIMYISSTAGLAEKQLGLIKSILTSAIYRRYWPEMVNEQEARRERWTTSEIAVDHPKRKLELIRDPTCFAVGLTSNVVGWHCDEAYMDDVVTGENAYTEEGRDKVKTAYSLLSSIENPDATESVVGTRYHPADLYNDMINMEREVFNEYGEVIAKERVFDVFERQVEDAGDGTGQFLWPREQRNDGQWFGFNTEVLATKKAQYLDKTQFYAQYYNNPNIGEESGIDRSRFQYYDRAKVRVSEGVVSFDGHRLNVFAAIDFAFSLSKLADYTAIVVLGISEAGDIYILDIDRFKTDKISEYFHRLRRLHVKWNFRRLRAEVTVAQSAIVREIKDQYFKPNAMNISIDEHRPSRHEGSKEERIRAILGGRYDNQVIWHDDKNPHTQALEDELIQAHPAHDDIKDSLASAVDIAVPPRGMGYQRQGPAIKPHSRFGGLGT